MLTAAHAFAKTIALIAIHKRLTLERIVVVVVVTDDVSLFSFRFCPSSWCRTHKRHFGILSTTQNGYKQKEEEEGESNETKIELCAVDSISIER